MTTEMLEKLDFTLHISSLRRALNLTPLCWVQEIGNKHVISDTVNVKVTQWGGAYFLFCGHCCLSLRWDSGDTSWSNIFDGKNDECESSQITEISLK